MHAQVDFYDVPGLDELRGNVGGEGAVVAHHLIHRHAPVLKEE